MTGSIPLPERFARLRELLSTSTEFLVPWNYFHDEMATRSDFMALGQLGEHPILNAALEAAMNQFGLVNRPRSMLTCHVPEYGFWHGIWDFSARTGIFFFDEATGQGLLGVMKDLTRGPVDLFRFTAVLLEEGAAFPMNQGRRGPPE
ncbi:hypothetical protein LZC95_34695 [Pendulispora brunnea]|uniref:Uncharacterized protein n=1 Tax=Pendulispora brunnea TaxID=2905690 RepID=A0ABZ2K5H9_9BACT